MTSSATPRLHLVGRSGHGKTTLATALIAHWSGMGRRIASLKHSPHAHETDVPGKDSWRHRQAGAVATAFIAGDRLAVHRTLETEEDPVATAASLLGPADLLLVEGGDGACQAEVWRAAAGGRPLACDRPGIHAVISDDPTGLALPQWPRGDLDALAVRLWDLSRQRWTGAPGAAACRA